MLLLQSRVDEHVRVNEYKTSVGKIGKGVNRHGQAGSSRSASSATHFHCSGESFMRSSSLRAANALHRLFLLRSLRPLLDLRSQNRTMTLDAKARLCGTIVLPMEGANYHG